jgi:glutathione S-transferase
VSLVAHPETIHPKRRPQGLAVSRTTFRGGPLTPVLWHIRISHYSEKARWALAFKGVEHERRAPLPGAHMLYALWLTRGSEKTFPVMRLDGKVIGDSTAIIAALEERFPEPALYPTDAAERSRALELEDWFDERLGPSVRLAAWHDVIADRESLTEIVKSNLPSALQGVGPATAAAARYTRGFVGVRYRAGDDEAVERARADVLAGLDRLEQGLGGGEYLVDGRFTVADLTAASLFYPLVNPPEGPTLPPPPASLERFRAPLKGRPGYLWVQEMFRRHRS